MGKHKGFIDIKIVSKIEPIALDKLHIRYIPVLTPIGMWNYDMRLKNSPHVELIQLIMKYGWDWDMIMKTRYVRERQHRYVCGLDKWTDEHIREHVEQRWKTYKSLRKYGYSKKREKGKPVIILKRSFWKSRFEMKEKWLKGLEIWNGSGRCAAAYCMGWNFYPAVLAKDKYPKTHKKGKFENKLRNVEGILD